MCYVLPILIALQIAMSPLCMTQMVQAQVSAGTDRSMVHMDRTQHMHHRTDAAQSSPVDPLPCGHGHCFSESGLESALAPDLELPATVAAMLPTPCTIDEIPGDYRPLPQPEEPPPIVLSVETVVLLQ
ncbi:MAG: hypothetical protein PHO20_01320 [Candidatus Peribacteraceae bacterium]|nr:hypothetical protein [Candidatus Peribacteraceae bacterium]MDD5739388.1 hypothetical protein [Candidatus Peribacteraceae bacterium]